MRLLRYGAPGREKPGLADADGNIRDLSKIITQIDDATLAPRNLARLARVKPETLPIVRGNPRLGVPYAGISKFVASSSDLQLIAFLKRGRQAIDARNTTGVPMPARGGNLALDDDALGNIVAFLRQVQREGARRD